MKDCTNIFQAFGHTCKFCQTGTTITMSCIANTGARTPCNARLCVLHAQYI